MQSTQKGNLSLNLPTVLRSPFPGDPFHSCQEVGLCVPEIHLVNKENKQRAASIIYLMKQRLHFYMLAIAHLRIAGLYQLMEHDCYNKKLVVQPAPYQSRAKYRYRLN